MDMKLKLFHYNYTILAGISNIDSDCLAIVAFDLQSCVTNLNKHENNDVKSAME